MVHAMSSLWCGYLNRPDPPQAGLKEKCKLVAEYDWSLCISSPPSLHSNNSHMLPIQPTLYYGSMKCVLCSIQSHIWKLNYRHPIGVYHVKRYIDILIMDDDETLWKVWNSHSYDWEECEKEHPQLSWWEKRVTFSTPSIVNWYLRTFPEQKSALNSHNVNRERNAPIQKNTKLYFWSLSKRETTISTLKE